MMMSLLAVGKWLVGAFVKVLLWTAAHPVAAILVGAGMSLGGLWLSQQEWAGAKTLGTLLGIGGLTLIQGGIGAWIMGKAVTFGKAVVETVDIMSIGYGVATGQWIIPVW